MTPRFSRESPSVANTDLGDQDAAPSGHDPQRPARGNQSMFLIPTFVGPSTIHGFGVFTSEPVRAGAVIWRFVDGVDLRLSGDDLDALPASIEDKIRSYSYREESGSYVLCGDNAKYMNHTIEPNCDDDGVVTTALENLPAGTELTCDYRSFDYDTIAGHGEWFTKREAATAPIISR